MNAVEFGNRQYLISVLIIWCSTRNNRYPGIFCFQENKRYQKKVDSDVLIGGWY